MKTGKIALKTAEGFDFEIAKTWLCEFLTDPEGTSFTLIPQLGMYFHVNLYLTNTYMVFNCLVGNVLELYKY